MLLGFYNFMKYEPRRRKPKNDRAWMDSQFLRLIKTSTTGKRERYGGRSKGPVRPIILQLGRVRKITGDNAFKD